MSGPRRGMSLIELLLVLAIAGVLLGIAALQLNPSGAATRQAAQVVAAAVNQARFEAIRSNNTAGIVFTAFDGTEPGLIEICRGVDEAAFTPSCESGTVFHTIRFSDADLARARMTSSLEVYFDRRGIVRNPGTATGTVTITDRGGGNVRTVTILATGRAEVQ